MKRLMTVGLMVLTAFVVVACDPRGLPQKDMGGGEQIIVPGETATMSAALVALSTACGAGQPISWTYSPVAALGANYNAQRDGAVTAGGVFTAPLCGSTLLGTKVNVVGSCAKADNSQTFVATVVFSVQQEQLGGTTLGFAAVQDCGTTVQCSATNPLSISPTLCNANQSPFTVQLYTRLDFTCGPVWDPATPPTNLAACSAAISPGVGGPPLCTSFTYTAYSACSQAGIQTRTVLTSLPAGCIGGTPVLSQTCVPPPDGAALWTANCQGCHGAIGGDKRGASAATIQAAINNNTGGMGRTSLRALTPAQVAAIAAANP